MDTRPPLRDRYGRVSAERPIERPAERSAPVRVSLPEESVKPKKTHRKRGFLAFVRRRWWQILIVVVIMAALGFFVQNYLHTRNELKKLSNSSTAADSSSQELIKQISGYVQLPQGETPTVATVNDVSKLKEQVFFKDAQNGDKVLIFSQAKTAILYRPSTKKIIVFAPVNVDANSGTTTGTSAPPAVKKTGQ